MKRRTTLWEIGQKIFRIHKMRVSRYQLFSENYQTLSLPVGAKILTAQLQEFGICLFVLEDERLFLESRVFAIHRTGNILPDNFGVYVATVNDNHGSAHIFEVK
jgi:hypothetical protein